MGCSFLSENADLLCCGIFPRGCRAIPAPPCFFLWAAEESLLWYQRLLHWSWLCCGFSLPGLLPMLWDILSFKFALSGTVSLANGLLFGLWWVWCGTSSVQHRAPPLFSGRSPLQLLPKLCHVNPIQVVRQGFTLWVNTAASAMLPWIAKLPAELAMVLLLKVPPTWSSHVSQTGYALKSPASVLVMTVWMSRRGSMWFFCDKWQYT